MKNGKKVLLILGAISVINEIVLNAKAKGYYVIVTDYYENSPAKQYADESWLLSIDDVDGIVEKCKENHVDGVMNYCIDPGQKPYQQICEKLGLPCVATFEQFDIMTNKDKFTEACKRYDVGVIPEFELDEHMRSEDIDALEFPVMVKPVDSRASKGLYVCHTKEEVPQAVEYALSFSKRKKIRVEKYLQGCPEVCAKYVACDGEIFFTTMADVYTCYAPGGTRVYLGTQTYPSKYYEEYIRTTNDKVISMLKGIGLKNGATSFTGFYDNGVFRFFDPSLRMGGAQDWRVADAASGVDISDLLTNFAIHGKMGDVDEVRKIDKAFARKESALLYFDIVPGKIARFEGIEEAAQIPGVVGYHQCHVIGDEVVKFGTSDNVAIRFILSCDSADELIDTIKKVQSVIRIEDAEGNSLIVSPFDGEILRK